MTLRERQDRFISDIEIFNNWPDRFNYLIMVGEELPEELPEYLLPHRIEGCQSKTCFFPKIHDGLLYINAWSNSAVMRGIVVEMIRIFNFTSKEEFLNTKIDFHIKSGIIDNLTPMRKDAIEEMIRRITILIS